MGQATHPAGLIWVKEVDKVFWNDAGRRQALKG